MSLPRGCKFVCLSLSFLLLPFIAAAQQERPDYSTLFDKTDVMIAARDGVKLHSEIYSPKNAAEPLPKAVQPEGAGFEALPLADVGSELIGFLPLEWLFARDALRFGLRIRSQS